MSILWKRGPGFFVCTIQIWRYSVLAASISIGLAQGPGKERQWNTQLLSHRYVIEWPVLCTERPARKDAARFLWLHGPFPSSAGGLLRAAPSHGFFPSLPTFVFRA